MGISAVHFLEQCYIMSKKIFFFGEKGAKSNADNPQTITSTITNVTISEKVVRLFSISCGGSEFHSLMVLGGKLAVYSH